MYKSSSKDASLVLLYAMAPHMQLPERGIVNKVDKTKISLERCVGRQGVSRMLAMICRVNCALKVLGQRIYIPRP